MKVLFVCSGNICRSPMAAEYMRHRAARSALEHLVVDSAGTLGIDDAPASAEAIRAMSEIGIDLRGHRSKGLCRTDLESCELAIGMAGNHLVSIAALHPDGRERRELLRAFEHGTEPDPAAPDLDDPMGHPLEVYREQLETIRRCIDHLVLDLRHSGLGGGESRRDTGALRGKFPLQRYARRVERAWSQLLDRPRLLSPREWRLISSWHERGIPLEVLEQAMNAVADRLADREGAPSLSYVAAAVEADWSAVVDGRRANPTPEPSAVEPPPPRETWEKRRRKESPGSPLAELIDTVLARLDAGESPAAVDRAVDERIVSVTSEEDLSRIDSELEATLGPFRQRMSRDAWNTTLRQGRTQRLRTRLGLPRLAGDESD